MTCSSVIVKKPQIYRSILDVSVIRDFLSHYLVPTQGSVRTLARLNILHHHISVTLELHLFHFPKKTLPQQGSRQKVWR